MDKIAALRDLAASLRINNHDGMDIGTFTYGKPKVLEWGEGAKVHIGKFCSIADNVVIMAGGEHNTDWITTYPFNKLCKDAYSNIKGHPKTKGDVWIGNDVWIARDAKIMSGVTICDGAVIAANAVVTHNVLPYSVYGGVPAKFIKYRLPKPLIHKLLNLKWWDWPIEKIAEAVPLLQSNNYELFIETYGRS